MTSTTTLNDNLVKVDNLITALNFLLEDLETRKKQFTDVESISDEVSKSVRNVIYSDWDIQNRIARKVADQNWERMIDHLDGRTRGVMQSLIENHVSVAVGKELERLGYDKPQVNQN